MDVTDFMGSSDYLKAADLKGKSVNVTVKDVCTATFNNDGKDQDKLVLFFKGRDKGVVLNVTNTRAMAAAYGPESDKWEGKKVVLSVRQTPLGDGIGVTAMPDEDFDDDIPF